MTFGVPGNRVASQGLGITVCNSHAFVCHFQRDPHSQCGNSNRWGEPMTTFDQMQQCAQTTKAAFKATVMGLRYAFCSIQFTDGGRLILVRAGDDRGPLVGYREDYCGGSYFYVRR